MESFSMQPNRILLESQTGPSPDISLKLQNWLARRPHPEAGNLFLGHCGSAEAQNALLHPATLGKNAALLGLSGAPRLHTGL